MQWRVGRSTTPGQPGWRIYFDDYMTKRYWYSDSFDGLQTWTAKKELGGVSGTVRRQLIRDSDVILSARRYVYDYQSLTTDTTAGRQDVTRSFGVDFGYRLTRTTRVLHLH